MHTDAPQTEYTPYGRISSVYIWAYLECITAEETHTLADLIEELAAPLRREAAL